MMHPPEAKHLAVITKLSFNSSLSLHPPRGRAKGETAVILIHSLSLSVVSPREGILCTEKPYFLSNAQFKVLHVYYFYRGTN